MNVFVCQGLEMQLSDSLSKEWEVLSLSHSLAAYFSHAPVAVVPPQHHWNKVQALGEIFTF